MQELEKPRKFEGKRPSKGQGSRIPHHCHCFGRKGNTISTSCGSCRICGRQHRCFIIMYSISRTSCSEGREKRSTSDRSRSRDPPQETTPAVPIAPQQVVMTVPDYMLPIMAQAGLGHISLDQPRVQVGSGSPLSSPTEAQSKNIRDFFEAFNQAEVQEEQVRAIQQFTQGLRDVPRLAGSPAPQETADTTTGVPGSFDRCGRDIARLGRPMSSSLSAHCTSQQKDHQEGPLGRDVTREGISISSGNIPSPESSNFWQQIEDTQRLFGWPSQPLFLNQTRMKSICYKQCRFGHIIETFHLLEVRIGDLSLHHWPPRPKAERCT